MALTNFSYNPFGQELRDLYEEERLASEDDSAAFGGFKAGYYGLGSSVQNTLAAGGRVIGADTFAENRERSADRYAAQAAGAGYKVPRLKDADSIGDYWDWGTGMIGQQIPLLASMAATSGAGSLTAAGAARLAGAGAQGLARSTRLGKTLGAATPYEASTVGGNYATVRQDPDAEGTPGEQAAASILYGTGQTALGMALDPTGLFRNSGLKGVTGVGIMAAGEAATETTEQLMQQHMHNLFNPEAGYDTDELIESAAAGGLIGGAFSLPGMFIGKKDAPTAPGTPDAPAPSGVDAMDLDVEEVGIHQTFADLGSSYTRIQGKGGVSLEVPKSLESAIIDRLPIKFKDVEIPGGGVYQTIWNAMREGRRPDTAELWKAAENAYHYHTRPVKRYTAGFNGVGTTEGVSRPHPQADRYGMDVVTLSGVDDGEFQQAQAQANEFMADRGFVPAARVDNKVFYAEPGQREAFYRDAGLLSKDPEGNYTGKLADDAGMFQRAGVILKRESAGARTLQTEEVNFKKHSKDKNDGVVLISDNQDVQQGLLTVHDPFNNRTAYAKGVGRSRLQDHGSNYTVNDKGEITLGAINSVEEPSVVDAAEFGLNTPWATTDAQFYPLSPPTPERGGNESLQQAMFSLADPAAAISADTENRLRNFNPLELVDETLRPLVEQGLDVRSAIDQNRASSLMRHISVEAERPYAFASEIVEKDTVKLLPETFNDLNARHRRLHGRDLQVGDKVTIHRDPPLPNATSMYTTTFGGVMSLTRGDWHQGVVINPNDQGWLDAGGDFDGDHAVVGLPTEHQEIRQRKTDSIEDLGYKLSGEQQLKLEGELFDSAAEAGADLGQDAIGKYFETSTNLFGEEVGKIVAFAQQMAEFGHSRRQVQLTLRDGSKVDITIEEALSQIAQAAISSKKKNFDVDLAQTHLAAIKDLAKEQLGYKRRYSILAKMKDVQNAPIRSIFDDVPSKAQVWADLVRMAEGTLENSKLPIKRALAERVIALDAIYSQVDLFAANKEFDSELKRAAAEMAGPPGDLGPKLAGILKKRYQDVTTKMREMRASPRAFLQKLEDTPEWAKLTAESTEIRQEMALSYYGGIMSGADLVAYGPMTPTLKVLRPDDFREIRERLQGRSMEHAMIGELNGKPVAPDQFPEGTFMIEDVEIAPPGENAALTMPAFVLREGEDTYVLRPKLARVAGKHGVVDRAKLAKRTDELMTWAERVQAIRAAANDRPVSMDRGQPPKGGYKGPVAKWTASVVDHQDESQGPPPDDGAPPPDEEYDELPPEYDEPPADYEVPTHLKQYSELVEQNRSQLEAMINQVAKIFGFPPPRLLSAEQVSKQWREINISPEALSKTINDGSKRHGFYGVEANVVYLRGDPERDTRAEMLTVLAHELGHAIMYHTWNSAAAADPKLKSAVLEDYAAFVAEVNARRKKDGKPAIEDPSENYKTNFSEWFADNIGRYLLDESAMATSKTEAFFKRAAEVLRKYINMLWRAGVVESKGLKQFFDAHRATMRENLEATKKANKAAAPKKKPAAKERPAPKRKVEAPEPPEFTRHYTPKTIAAGMAQEPTREALRMKRLHRLRSWGALGGTPDITQINDMVDELSSGALDDMLTKEDANLLRRIAQQPEIRRRMAALIKDPTVLGNIENNADVAAAWMFALSTSGIMDLPREGSRVSHFLRNAFREWSMVANADDSELRAMINDMAAFVPGPEKPIFPEDSPSAALYAERAGRPPPGFRGVVFNIGRMYRGAFSWYMDVPYQRILDTGNPALISFARRMQPMAWELGGFKPGGAVERSRAAYQLSAENAANIIQPLSAEEQKQLRDIMMNVPGAGKRAPQTVRAAAARLRKILDGLYGYDRDAGLDVRYRKNYWPIMWNRKAIGDREAQFMELVSDPRFEEDWKRLREYQAEAAYNQLIDMGVNAEEAGATRENELRRPIDEVIRETMVRDDGSIRNMLPKQKVNSPSFRSMNARQTDFLLETGDQEFHEKLLEFVDDDPKTLIHRYIKSSVKRAEFNRLIQGAGGHRGLQQTIYAARAQGASEKQVELLLNYISATQGFLGLKERDAINRWVERNGEWESIKGFHTPGDQIMSDRTRDMNSFAMAFQVVSHLMLSGFTNMMDPLGQLARHGSFGRFTESMKAAHRAAKADTSDSLGKKLEMLGVMERAFNVEDLAETYYGMNVTPRVQKFLDGFFKYNGTMWITERTRTASAIATMMSLRDWHNDLQGTDVDKRQAARVALNELGLQDGDIELDTDGYPKTFNAEDFSDNPELRDRALRIAVAVHRMVDESSVRPDPTNRPLYSSNPYFAAMAQWKQFLTAFDNQILRPAMNRALDQGNMKPLMWMFLTMVPTMLFADMLRDAIRSLGDEDDEWRPEWKRNWTLTDHVLYAIERSGMYGRGELVGNVLSPLIEGDIKRATTEILGPTSSDIANLMIYGPSAKMLPAGDIINDWTN